MQVLAVAHFAERYSLFVIIRLGESIVAVGLGRQPPRRTARLALYGGIALYFVGLAAFRYRILGSPGRTVLGALATLASTSSRPEFPPGSPP